MLMLGQGAGDLTVRLEVATRLGWLEAERTCCGRGWRYRITPAGERSLK